ncbi:DUF6436 domain-containing protein [Pseudoalteromonas sp.]|uniref:DUF6436 domain-containing protein n=1 Tax=Pseudoalteromonas sp. TaxID=53249 RepID=UPI0035626DC5
MIGLLFLSTKQVTSFDHQGELSRLAMDTGFDVDFVNQVFEELGDVSGAVIHFGTEDCFCLKVAEEHVNSIKLLATKMDYKNYNIQLDKQLKLKLPSVPAVAVINKQSSLSYLGPYSTGMFCAEGKGLVEPYLLNSSTKQNFFGAAIITDAKGCYCNLS